MTIIDSLSDHFSPQQLELSEEVLLRYGSSLSGSVVKPSAVFFPESTDDVLKIVQLANSQRVVLFPISRGKNFGYNEAQGSAEGQVIVDMSRMNKIVEVNEKLAYATIQPGVSQQQLSNYLKEKNLKFQLDVTGAGYDASIVGNILERGFGHTDYGDRWARVISLEVVLGNGSVIRTGMNSSENTYRYGIGPMLDGLFSQSNFGIITQMTFELMPKPERMLMFVLSTKEEKNLEGIVAAIRELKLQGIVQSAVHIANKARAVGEKENKLAGVWNLSGNISGNSNLISSKKSLIRKAFSKHIRNFRLMFIGKGMLNSLKWIYENITPMQVYPALRDIYELQDGVPTEEPLRTLLNDATLHSSTLNARQYQQGFYWLNAVINANENDVRKAIDVLTKLFAEWKYEFRVTMTYVNPRCMILISNISFQKTEEEIKRAADFCKLCYKELQSAGYYPYRSGSNLYDKLPPFEKNYSEVLQQLKKVFDPNNIIAPGKYNIT